MLQCVSEISGNTNLHSQFMLSSNDHSSNILDVVNNVASPSGYGKTGQSDWSFIAPNARKTWHKHEHAVNLQPLYWLQPLLVQQILSDPLNHGQLSVLLNTQLSV